jgi:hypothetical protein
MMNGKEAKSKPIKRIVNESTTCLSRYEKPFVLARIRSRMNEYLKSKYATSTFFYYTRDIDAIVHQKRVSSTIKFHQIMDSDSKLEVLKRYYKRHETAKKIVQLAEYFKFHYEIPRIFLEGFIGIIDTFHDRRRNQIYQIVKMQIGKENIVGDETNSQLKDQLDQRVNYTSILKGLKTNQRYHMSRGDSLHDLLTQMEALRLSNVKGDISVATNDSNQNKIMDFNRYLLNVHKSQEKPKAEFQVSTLKQLNFKKNKEPEKSKKGDSVKKKNRITIVSDHLNEFKGGGGLKSVITRVLSGMKGTPQRTVKKEALFKKKKSMAETESVKTFEKPLTKSELKNNLEIATKASLFSRNNSLFNSMKENLSTGPRNPSSTRNHVSPDLFARYNYATLRTESDLFDMHLPKNFSHGKKMTKLTTQLTEKFMQKGPPQIGTVKSFDDRRRSKMLTLLTEDNEPDTNRVKFSGKAQILASRSSFSHIFQGNSSKKSEILKRLKSEGKEGPDVQLVHLKESLQFTSKPKAKLKKESDSGVKLAKKKSANKDPSFTGSFKAKLKGSTANFGL